MSRLVVAFDTATDVCSVALLRVSAGVETLHAESVVVGRSHTRLLLTLVDRALVQGGVDVGEVGAVVVGTGPGTFTGVRLAVASARAFALSRGVPVLGVPTLGALASSAARGLLSGTPPCDAADPDVIVPVVDARRHQVFVGFYRRTTGSDGSPRWRRDQEYAAVEPADLPAYLLAQRVRRPLLVGDPALVEGVAVPQSDPPGAARSAPGLPVMDVPVAAEGLLLGQASLDEPGDGPVGARLVPWLLAANGPGRRSDAPGEIGSPESVRPLYLRPPDADMHITRMRDPWA